MSRVDWGKIHTTRLDGGKGTPCHPRHSQCYKSNEQKEIEWQFKSNENISITWKKLFVAKWRKSKKRRKK
jgi:hypothetical protein